MRGHACILALVDTGSTRLKNTTTRPRVFFIVICFYSNGLKWRDCFLFGFELGWKTWDFGNIGKQPILRIWESENIGTQAILRTLDPGNTGSQTILGTLDPGSIGSLIISAPFRLQHLEKDPFWELVPGKMNMVGK